MKHSVLARFACIFTLCSSLTCNAQTASFPVSARDLENLAIVDDVRQSTLEKMLNHCHTQTGKDYFRRSLCELSSDKAELEQRQSYLKLFVETPETTLRLNNHLKTCGSLEPALNPFEKKNGLPALDEFYFKRTPCVPLNKSAASLNASYFLHYVNLFTPLVEHAVLHMGVNSLFSSGGKKSHGHHSHDHGHHHHGHGCCAHDHGFSPKQAMYYLVQGGHWALHAPGYYEMLTHMHMRKKKISAAQADLAQLKSYLEAVHAIYTELMDNDPEFVKAHMPIIGEIFDAFSNNPASIMVTKILSSSWTSSLQSTLNPGSILALYAMIETQIEMLKEVAREVGIVDAYSNVAHAVLAQSGRYCFVTFIENPRPRLTMDGVWHHAISTDTMKPLAISLDESNPCLMVRGANGSGKSTLLTAVGHALFLAQSWGIAPAQQATMTPFSHVYTHSLKRDSIEQGLSHFYYEHSYYENMFAQAHERNSILFLDEPYMCTDPLTGKKHVKTLTNRIMQYPQRLALITTHYEDTI